MDLSFVNIHGRPLDLPPVEAPKPARRTQSETFHKGWQVTGFSPAQLEHARRLHDELRKDKPDLGPFDPVSYMKTSRPRRVRAKPYEVHEAAMLCAEIARREGWQSVQVVAKAKGVSQ